MYAINNENLEQRCFFLDGPAGLGKTYLYGTLMSYLRGKNQIVLPFATTGIAADLLKDGRTMHSGFQLPVPILETSTSNMRISSPEAQVLKDSALLIIDESTMMTNHALRCIDLMLREIMKNDKPFGGKVLVLGGDFRQTLPVVPRSTRAQVIEACIKTSNLWRHFQVIRLSVNMRSEGQEEFNQWTLRIGDGTITNEHGLLNEDMEIPPQMVETENIIKAIYNDSIDIENLETLSTKIIITTKNKDVLSLNNGILMPGNIKEYKSADSIITDEPQNILNFPVEFLNAQTPSGMPPHLLQLKVGSLIMLIRNLNSKRGLCNGTRLIVKGLFENFLATQILTGSNKGERVFIPRIDLAPSETNLPFTLKRRQFPVIPAFVITVNKSQGQTFDHVGVYLPESVFTHGQLYVAVTRTRSQNNLKFFLSEDEKQGSLLNNHRKFTRNVVYHEILL